jgi:hypothetical protein
LKDGGTDAAVYMVCRSKQEKYRLCCFDMVPRPAWQDNNLAQAANSKPDRIRLNLTP